MGKIATFHASALLRGLFWLPVRQSGHSAVAILLFCYLFGATQEARSGDCKIAASEVSPAARVAEIVSQYQAALDVYDSEFSAAKGDLMQRLQISETFRNTSSQLKAELEGIVRASPTEPGACAAAIAIVSEFYSPLNEELVAILREHHMDTKGMAQLCVVLGRRPGQRWARRLLIDISQQHASPDVRGQAVLSLGDYYLNSSRPRSGEVLHGGREKVVLELAEQYYRRAAEEFGYAMTANGKTTVGERARGEIARFENIPTLRAGGRAPNIGGTDLNGQPLRLEDYRGKVVVLSFWGSRCAPCIRMIPHENELAHRHRDAPFAILGINCGDALETARGVAEMHKMSWRSWWDGGPEHRGPIHAAYNVWGLPSTFVLDQHGVIQAMDVRGEELDEVVERLLKKMNGD